MAGVDNQPGSLACLNGKLQECIALAANLQVPEPSKNEILKMLKQVKQKIQDHQCKIISEDVANIFSQKAEPQICDVEQHKNNESCEITPGPVETNLQPLVYDEPDASLATEHNIQDEVSTVSSTHDAQEQPIRRSNRQHKTPQKFLNFQSDIPAIIIHRDSDTGVENEANNKQTESEPSNANSDINLVEKDALVAEDVAECMLEDEASTEITTTDLQFAVSQKDLVQNSDISHVVITSIKGNTNVHELHVESSISEEIATDTDMTLSESNTITANDSFIVTDNTEIYTEEIPTDITENNLSILEKDKTNKLLLDHGYKQTKVTNIPYICIRPTAETITAVEENTDKTIDSNVSTELDIEKDMLNLVNTGENNGLPLLPVVEIKKVTKENKLPVPQLVSVTASDLAVTSSETQKHKSKTQCCICSECGKEFKNISNLTVHMRIHNDERPFQCTECDKQFTTKANMTRHIKNTHFGERNFQCPDCNKRFSEKKSMHIHRLTHTNTKPYVCDLCGKSFSQSGPLHSHKLIHKGEKNHVCSFCGKTFIQKSTLSMHLKRHRNIKEYSCDKCDKFFICKSELARHKVKHTGERGFSCPMCPRAFSRLQYLKEHISWHTGTRPYNCRLCDQTFRDMVSYSRHARQVHSTGLRDGVPVIHKASLPAANQYMDKTVKREDSRNPDITELSNSQIDTSDTLVILMETDNQSEETKIDTSSNEIIPIVTMNDNTISHFADADVTTTTTITSAEENAGLNEIIASLKPGQTLAAIGPNQYIVIESQVDKKTDSPKSEPVEVWLSL